MYSSINPKRTNLASKLGINNKVLIRSIGTNSYYLKFAIMGLLSYILDNEIPKVWNS